MMIGKATHTLTEWEWFQTQLRLEVMEVRGPKFVTIYTFAEAHRKIDGKFPDALIQCSFWCSTTDALLKKKARRDKHLEFYATWVEAEEQRLREIIARFPGLSKEFDLNKHVVYTILHNYGMGSLPVCHFYNRAFHWSMSAEMVPK